MSDETRVSRTAVVRWRKSRGRASKRRSNLKRTLAYQLRRAIVRFEHLGSPTPPVEFTVSPPTRPRPE